MKKLVILVAATGIYVLFAFSSLQADDNLEDLIQNIRIGGQFFLSYLSGAADGVPNVNEVVINRGYLNVHKELSKNLVGRITPDVSVDHEGDGLGDVELRLKYAHLITKLNDLAILTKPYFEFGLVHRPWLDYEEHINNYRAQGTMFLERIKVFNSADFGITFVSLLGGELDKEYQNRVSNAFPGRFGSFAIGIYNGGGYHSIEVNENKSIETRLSVRPLNGTLPGLQVHYTGAYGNGNAAYSPDWVLNGAMVSYEAARFRITAQLYSGIGNSYGHFIDENQKAKPHAGYSLFGEYKISSTQLSLFARYDYWNGNKGEEETNRVIAGIAYHFAGRSKLLLDYDLFSDKIKETTTGIFEVALEVRF
ncbi:hypothetical protein EH223_07760 [candidate division KSB1 bacterium]|nr:hypothetical protein [candidate division KSB1 bacterium]RQW04273.1 MAG: hypothetical protein EH223_07760 [candidate division KSB1 bacterium]